MPTLPDAAKIEQYRQRVHREWTGDQTVAESVAALNRFADANGLTIPLEIVIGSGTRPS